ncbi:hypothetical protein QR685DRAFT_34768 [Neurospora intermedia]|uniref:Secreted protein n=1 Tax=Neurospora intermedia TaxID=5142 RepID=A0ABR3DR05_NEUIN
MEFGITLSARLVAALTTWTIWQTLSGTKLHTSSLTSHHRAQRCCQSLCRGQTSIPCLQWPYAYGQTPVRYQVYRCTNERPTTKTIKIEAGNRFLTSVRFSLHLEVQDVSLFSTMTAGQHCLRFASSSVSCFTPTLGALKPSCLGNILQLMGSICCEPRRVPLRPMNPAHTHSKVTQVIWFESISLARRTGTQHTSSGPGKQSDMKKPDRKHVSVIECSPVHITTAFQRTSAVSCWRWTSRAGIELLIQGVPFNFTIRYAC